MPLVFTVGHIPCPFCALSGRRGEVSYKEPKTARSRRRVAMTAKLLDFLTGYRQDRKLLGMPTKDDDLVFCHRDGAPVSPSTVDHSFTATVKTADLPGLRFHDLRHTFASLALMRGAKPKAISEALGHSSVAFTIDAYSHIMEGMQEDMMILLDEIIPSGLTAKPLGGESQEQRLSRTLERR